LALLHGPNGRRLCRKLAEEGTAFGKEEGGERMPDDLPLFVRPSRTITQTSSALMFR
jgi:hypothetical protein